MRYKIAARKDRKTYRGGVMILIKPSIECYETTLNILGYTTNEYCSIVVGKASITVIYCPKGNPLYGSEAT